MSDRRYRRTVLASLGTAAATALAGCNSTSNKSSNPKNGTQTATSTQPSNGDVFESINPSMSEGTAVLDVSVTDSTVSTVAVRDSSGNEVARHELGTGTATQLPLTGLEAGTFDVVAVKNENIVGKQSITLERSYEVEDVSFVEGAAIGTEKTVYIQIGATVTNTGNLPVAFADFRAFEGVPRPTSESGETMPLVDGGTASLPVWNPGETREMKTMDSVLTASGVDGPTTEKQTAKVELNAKRGPAKTLTIEYSLSGSVHSAVDGLSGRTESTISDWSVSEP